MQRGQGGARVSLRGGHVILAKLEDKPPISSSSNPRSTTTALNPRRMMTRPMESSTPKTETASSQLAVHPELPLSVLIARSQAVIHQADASVATMVPEAKNSDKKKSSSNTANSSASITSSISTSTPTHHHHMQNLRAVRECLAQVFAATRSERLRHLLIVVENTMRAHNCHFAPGAAATNGGDDVPAEMKGAGTDGDHHQSWTGAGSEGGGGAGSEGGGGGGGRGGGTDAVLPMSTAHSAAELRRLIAKHNIVEARHTVWSSFTERYRFVSDDKPLQEETISSSRQGDEFQQWLVSLISHANLRDTRDCCLVASALLHFSSRGGKEIFRGCDTDFLEPLLKRCFSISSSDAHDHHHLHHANSDNAKTLFPTAALLCVIKCAAACVPRVYARSSFCTASLIQSVRASPVLSIAVVLFAPMFPAEVVHAASLFSSKKISAEEQTEPAAAAAAADVDVRKRTDDVRLLAGSVSDWVIKLMVEEVARQTKEANHVMCNLVSRLQREHETLRLRCELLSVVVARKNLAGLPATTLRVAFDQTVLEAFLQAERSSEKNNGSNNDENGRIKPSVDHVIIRVAHERPSWTGWFSGMVGALTSIEAYRHLFKGIDHRFLSEPHKSLATLMSMPSAVSASSSSHSSIGGDGSHGNNTNNNTNKRNADGGAFWVEAVKLFSQVVRSDRLSSSSADIRHAAALYTIERLHKEAAVAKLLAENEGATLNLDGRTRQHSQNDFSSLLPNLIILQKLCYSLHLSSAPHQKHLLRPSKSASASASTASATAEEEDSTIIARKLLRLGAASRDWQGALQLHEAILSSIAPTRSSVITDSEYEAVLTAVCHHAMMRSHVAAQVSRATNLVAAGARNQQQHQHQQQQWAEMLKLWRLNRDVPDLKHVTRAVAFAALTQGGWRRAVELLRGRRGMFYNNNSIEHWQHVAVARRVPAPIVAEFAAASDTRMSYQQQYQQPHHEETEPVLSSSSSSSSSSPTPTNNKTTTTTTTTTTPPPPPPTTTTTTTRQTMQTLERRLDGADGRVSALPSSKFPPPSKSTSFSSSSSSPSLLLRDINLNNIMRAYPPQRVQEYYRTVSDKSPTKSGVVFDRMRNVMRPSGQAFASAMNAKVIASASASSSTSDIVATGTTQPKQQNDWVDALELFQDAWMASEHGSLRSEVYLGALSFCHNSNSDGVNDRSSSSLPPVAVTKAVVNAAKGSRAFALDPRVATALINTAASARLWSDVIDCFFLLLDNSTRYAPDRISIGIVLTACKQIDARSDKLLREVKSYLEATLEDSFAVLGEDVIEHVTWFRTNSTTIVQLELRCSSHATLHTVNQVSMERHDHMAVSASSSSTTNPTSVSRPEN